MKDADRPGPAKSPFRDAPRVAVLDTAGGRSDPAQPARQAAASRESGRHHIRACPGAAFGPWRQASRRRGPVAPPRAKIVTAPFHPAQPAFYERLLESQYWPPERRTDEQRSRLERMLRHARANVPFYANRLESLFTRRGDVDWSKLIALPILSRQDLLSQRAQMQSTNLPAAHGAVHVGRTSGSTGPALSISQSEFANAVTMTARFRAHRWHDLDWSKDLLFWFGEDPEQGRWPDAEIRNPWGPGWLSEATGRELALNRHASAGQVLDYAIVHGIRYLSMRARPAQALALEAKRLRKPLDLGAIMTFSTAATEKIRRDCEAAFGARTIALYSSKEAGLIAHQCPTGPHFHVNEETVLVEIVDANGAPCPPGVAGRVLVTPLFNYAQPLVRYEQGDVATFGPPCGCGRTLKVIESIAGREAHLFRLPGGERVALSLSPEVQDQFGALYWQIAQVAPLEIEVRYVPDDREERDEARLTETIRGKTDRQMQVRYRPVDDLFRADGRKFIEYVCELPASADDHPPR